MVSPDIATNAAKVTPRIVTAASPVTIYGWELDIRRGFAQIEPMTWDREIDARGLICPLPVLKAAKTLRAMGEGDVLRLLADDPVAIVDIPNFCREAGHAFLSQADLDDGQAYLISCGSTGLS